LFVPIIHRTFVPQKNLTMSEKTIKVVNFDAGDFPEGVETLHLRSSKNSTLHVNFPDTVKKLVLKEQHGNPFETLNLKKTKIEVLEFSSICELFDEGVELDGEMLPEGLKELEIGNVKSVKNLHVLNHLVKLKINGRHGETKIENSLPQSLISFSAPYSVVRNNVLPSNLKQLEIKIDKDSPEEELLEEYKIPASVETFKATAYQKGWAALLGNDLKIDYKNSNVKHLELDHSSIGAEGLDGEMLPESLETLQFLQYLPKKPTKNLHLLHNLKALKIFCSMVDHLVVDGETTLPENLEYLEVHYKIFVELCMANKCPQNLKFVTLSNLGHFLGDNKHKGFRFPKNIQTVNAPMLSLEQKNMFEKRFAGIEINPEDFGYHIF
jgi:hypothetical protein